MYALLFALLAMTSPARPTNVCVAIEVPMSSTESVELGPEAQLRLDRFFRGSPMEMEWPSRALEDQEAVFLIVAPYGDMHGYTQNQNLTRERGEAIRRHILRHRDRWRFTPGRVQVVELPHAAMFLSRAGVVRDRAHRHFGYVLIDYPEDRLPASAAGMSPTYCAEVFSR